MIPRSGPWFFSLPCSEPPGDAEMKAKGSFMFRQLRLWLLLFYLSVLSANSAVCDPPAVDRYGDPLPPGALARLGTTRRRPMASELAFRDNRTFITCGPGRTLRFWDVDTGEVKKTRQLPGGDLRRAIFSRDGKRLAVLTEDDLSVWDVDTGKRLSLIHGGRQRSFRQAVFSPDGRSLATAEFTGAHTVRLWDLATGEEKMLGKVSHFLLSMTFSPDGKRLILAVQDRTFLCWNAADGKQLWKRSHLPRGGVDFSPDSRVLAFGDPTDLRRVRLIDASSGKSLDHCQFRGVKGVFRVQFSPDGKTLAIGTDRGIAIWDLAADKQFHFLDGASFRFAFAPDGKSIISLGGVLERWDTATGTRLYEDTSKVGHTEAVGMVAWSPDGRRFASIGTGNFSSLLLWSAANGRLLHALPRQTEGEWPGWRFIAFTPDGKYLLSGGDCTIGVWDAAARQIRHWPTLDAKGKEKPGWLARGHLSRDGKTLEAITQELDSTHETWLKTWDVATGQRRSTRQVTLRLPNATVFSSDGRLLIDTGGIVQGATTGKARFQLATDGEIGDMYGQGIAFAPDGASIAGLVRQSVPNGKLFVQYEAKGIQFWRTDTGRPFLRLPVRALCRFVFSPDGRLLAAVGEESIRLWEVASAKEVFQRPVAGNLFGKHGSAAVLAFAPDGRSLATGLSDTTILIWDMMPAARDSSRPLSTEEQDRLWRELAGSDAVKAYIAVGRLIARPAETLPLLHARLRPIVAPSAERLKQLLADLDSDEFRRRDAAYRQLADLGESVQPALREALKGNTSVESRRRIERLLAQLMPDIVRSPEMLRSIRAVAVLEQIGTPRAKEHLADLAKGASTARLTHEAERALRRMDRAR